MLRRDKDQWMKSLLLFCEISENKGELRWLASANANYYRSFKVYPKILCLVFCFLLPAIAPGFATADELQKYVDGPEKDFSWQKISSEKLQGGELVELRLQSQRWRGSVWSHALSVYIPDDRRNPDSGFLLVSNGRGVHTKLLRLIADRAGIVVAQLRDVPNQPLFDGLTEDRLIAYSFDQYRKTLEPSWPLLFPMVKSVSAAMKSLQSYTELEFGEPIEGFIVSGASKRGWTVWLAAAVDRRIKAVAPMVFDMLNMKVQTEWATKSYGAQSEKIQAYTELGLVADIDTPPILRLRSWIDPYSYRRLLTQPKLILLATNDPYWTVDALSHYFSDLPDPKLVYYNPNTGHSLRAAEHNWQTLATWTQMLADSEPQAKLQWEFNQSDSHTVSAELLSEQPMKRVIVWQADSASRDFREAQWRPRELDHSENSFSASHTVIADESRYQAFFFEGWFQSSRGNDYRLSSEVRVVDPQSVTHTMREAD